MIGGILIVAIVLIFFLAGLCLRYREEGLRNYERGWAKGRRAERSDVGAEMCDARRDLIVLTRFNGQRFVREVHDAQCSAFHLGECDCVARIPR